MRNTITFVREDLADHFYYFSSPVVVASPVEISPQAVVPVAVVQPPSTTLEINPVPTSTESVIVPTETLSISADQPDNSIDDGSEDICAADDPSTA